MENQRYYNEQLSNRIPALLHECEFVMHKLMIRASFFQNGPFKI